MPSLGLSAFLFICGMLILIFARQLSSFNNKLVNSFPDPIRAFYQNTASMGHPYDSDFWIRYNRIGGIILAAVGAIATVVVWTFR